VTRRRALVAAFVALAGAMIGVAGVGHAYLRLWNRAVAWCSLVLGTGLALVAILTTPEAVLADGAPPTVVGPIAVLLSVSVVDAYRVGVATDRSPSTASDAVDDSDSPTCPSCGREVDASIDFCWYCAEPVDDDLTAR